MKPDGLGNSEEPSGFHEILSSLDVLLSPECPSKADQAQANQASVLSTRSCKELFTALIERPYYWDESLTRVHAKLN